MANSSIFTSASGYPSHHEQLPAYQDPSHDYLDACWKPRRSLPYDFFHDQVYREVGRINWRRCRYPVQDRSIDLYNAGLSVEKIAANNVRSKWERQGIWQPQWGPAWKPEPYEPPLSRWNRLGSDYEQHRRYQPDHGPGPWPIGRWEHEIPPAPPEPTPEPEPPLFTPRTQAWAARCRKPALPPRQPARDREASRPDRQFQAQIEDECEWIAAVHRLEGQSLNSEDITILARTSITNFWKERGWWLDEWTTQPGKAWIHERRRPTTPPAPVAEVEVEVEVEPPSYEEATRTCPPRGVKRKAETAPVRRSARIATQGARKAMEAEPRRSKRLRRL